MMKLLTKLPKLLLCCCLLGSFAAAAQSKIYTRPIPELRDSWNSIVLPNDIYMQLQPPFHELRIYGKTTQGDTVEAPYVVRSLKQTPKIVEWALPILNQSFADGAYFYSFQVPADSIVSRIQLDFGIRNFDFPVTLEGSDNGTSWFTVLNDYRLVAISNPETNFAYSTLNFPRVGYRLLRLKVPSATDPLLKTASVQFQQTANGFPEFYSSDIQQTISQQNKNTIIDLRLSQKLPVSAFLFEIAETEAFKRSFTIEYVTDSSNNNGQQQYIYSVLTAAELSSSNSLLFFNNEVLATTFRISIQNNDNQALPILSLKPGGFGYQLLVRVNKPGNYWLQYGNKNVPAPQYDIAAFVPASTDSFFIATAGQAVLLETVTTKAAEPFWSSPLFLWVAMGFIIIILGWFSLSMIRNKQKESSV